MAEAKAEERDPGASSFFGRFKRAQASGSVPGSIKASAARAKASSPVDAPAYAASSAAASTSKERASSTHRDSSAEANGGVKSYRLTKFEAILEADNVDLAELRKLSWNGVPPKYRAMVWQLLLGYLPTNKQRREATLQRKRKEYADSLPIYFEMPEHERTAQDAETLRQILVDLPRTCPGLPFFHQTPVQRSMERILYVWAIRHPASGYVQGINDLLTPLFVVFMSVYVDDVWTCDVTQVGEEVMNQVEADCYYCLTKLLDNIQDHYTFSQPGLQRMILKLEDLMHRLDIELHSHFEREGLQYMQFAFRWMNCLLLRELPLHTIIRVWDTYLSEERGGFESFHVYVCAVLLKTLRDSLLSLPFQDLIIFLQTLPTADWGDAEIEPILSQAYILSISFEGSPNHLA